MGQLLVTLELLVLWIVGCPMLTSPSSPRNPSEEERLLDLLFDGYNPSARPVINSKNTVPVRMQFCLLQIQELNLRSQVLTTTGLLILEWYDERLTWSRDEFPLQDVVVEAKKLWRPEFASINGADGIYGDYGQFRAIINSTGLIHWEPGGVFKTVCEIDITYYPFDEQVCTVIFGAWSYPTTKMNLSNIDTVVNLDSYEKNGEWEIITTKVERREFAFECCPNTRFSNIAFTIHLGRRYTFYVMNVILPSLMTSVLLLSIFFCTPAQKVQIGVVVLLSFRIFLLNVTGSIPKTSDHIPLLGIYLTCTMAITTLSMVLTVFVLNLHHVTDTPVPYWVKRLVLVYLARSMCMFSHVSKDAIREKPNRRHRYTVTSSRLERSYTPPVLPSVNGGPTENHNPYAPSTSTDFIGSKSRVYSEKDSETEQQKKKKKEEDYSKEWKRVAEVVDRLFFWFFFIAILVTTLLLFHPLTKTYTGGPKK